VIELPERTAGRSWPMVWSVDASFFDLPPFNRIEGQFRFAGDVSRFPPLAFFPIRQALPVPV